MPANLIQSAPSRASVRTVRMTSSTPSAKAPSSTSAMAHAAPRPRPAPVTPATLSSKIGGCDDFLADDHTHASTGEPEIHHQEHDPPAPEVRGADDGRGRGHGRVRARVCLARPRAARL
ncbi:hypothetical protein [Amycolatopsis sp. NPDC051716]|uniref:hypothetical protein n=1 Tax=Amycolatopsis sp. NPDC051716 TaxID=3155804 RepID=UPI0034251A89